MTKICISGETTKPKDVIVDHLVNLLNNRLKEIKKEITKQDDDIQDYEQKYDMSNEEFQTKFASGELDDDDEYYVWEGLIEVKRELINEKEALKELH